LHTSGTRPWRPAGHNRPSLPCVEQQLSRSKRTRRRSAFCDMRTAHGKRPRSMRLANRHKPSPSYQSA
jgi:hypothetical protein